jgi:hypothetical protein
MGRLRPYHDVVNFGVANKTQAPTDVEDYRTQPRLAILADGGLWNNLGTQVFREDGFRYGVAAIANAPALLLCINASATLRPSGILGYQLPGVSLITSLFRGMRILNTNTVLPRTQAMMNAAGMRAAHYSYPSQDDPLDVIVDLRTIEETRLQMVRYWDLSYAPSVYGLPVERPEAEQAPGYIDEETLDAINRFDGWKELKELTRGTVTIQTTLGRIDRNTARLLVALGYVNTFLMSWIVYPPSDPDREMAKLVHLRERLEDLLPSPTH